MTNGRASMRVVMRAIAIGVAWASCAAFALPNGSSALSEFDVARKALRDGLWETADAHAQRAERLATNAQDIVWIRQAELEALTCAGKVDAAVKRLSAWPSVETQDEGFRLWRAVFAAESNDVATVRSLLASHFTRNDCRALALRLEARLAARAGDGKQAEKHWSEAAVLVAHDAPARAANALEWARFRRLAGDAAGALDVLRVQKAAVAPDPDGARAQAFEADLLDELGRRDEARTVREKVRARVLPRDLSLHVELAQALGDLPLASLRSNAVVRIRACVRAMPDAAACREGWLAMADALLSAGDAVSAAEEYRLFLEAYPKGDVVHALEGQAWALAQSGKRAEAIATFARAARMSTNAAVRLRCELKRGAVLLADGRVQEAAEAFSKLPGDEARFRAADAWERAGMRGKAEPGYKALAVATNGTFAVEARLRLAAFAAEDGRLDDALAAYETLLGAGSLDAAHRARALSGRGRVHYRALRFAAAAEDFVAAGRLDPQRTEEMRFLSALCLYGQGKDAAARAVAADLSVQTTNAVLKVDLAFWLGRFDFDCGDWEKAEREFVQAAQTCSNAARKSEAWTYAGRAAGARNDYSKSVQYLSRALDAAGGDVARKSAIYLAQGEALVELARFDEAVYVLERVDKESAFATRATMLKADAFFALGADDDARYAAALEQYRVVARDDASPSVRLAAEFKAGRALEKLRRFDEAADQYYVRVVLAYVEARKKGTRFDTTARTFFARAAFLLADRFESRGDDHAALSVLRLVRASGAVSAEEADRRMRAIKAKGGLE